MNKATLLVLATLAPALVLAQDVQEKDVSAATKRYHDYRQQDTEPPFGLAKVKAAIKAIKPVDDKDGNGDKAASALWSRMSVPERFTYCMLHGEVGQQNCEGMPWLVDEEKKVFATPPAFQYGQEEWSPRQRGFLAKNRGETIRLLRATIRTRGRVGANLKNAIIEIHAVELIPDLVKVYDRDHRDQDILAVLAVLMKDGKDKTFLASQTWRKLYGPDANYKSYIVANEANQKLMTARAMAFYHRRMG